MVGGNGRKVTWRLAAEFADELNLDAVPAPDIPGALEVIRGHCEAVGRDPDSLRVSVHLWWGHVPEGRARVQFLRGYRDLGLARVMTLVRDAVGDRDGVRRFVDDAVNAGYSLGGAG
jgi:hypothetical protein